MAVDFSGVRVGDLVKLSRGEDEFVQIRVTHVTTTPLHWVQDVCASTHYADEWDTLEIVKPPLPTKFGSVIRGKKYGQTLVLTDLGWVNVGRAGVSRGVIDANDAYVKSNHDEYDTLFDPED